MIRDIWCHIEVYFGFLQNNSKPLSGLISFELWFIECTQKQMNITNDFPVNNVINGIYFRRKWVNYTKRKEILRCIQDQRRGYVEYVLPTSDYKKNVVTLQGLNFIVHLARANQFFVIYGCLSSDKRTYSAEKGKILADSCLIGNSCFCI